jgi:hypothetical protein
VAAAKQRGKAGWPLVLLGAVALAAAAPSGAQQGDGTRNAPTIDHAIEFYISDEALQAQYVRMLDLGELGPTQARGGFFYNEHRDLVATGDLLAFVGDEVNVRSLELRVGTRLYGAFLADEDEDVFSVAIGGEAEYYFNAGRTASVMLGLFYAPDIVTFGTADNVKDATLRITTNLRDGTQVFFGFRMLEFDLPTDREIDDNVHIGFRRSF